MILQVEPMDLGADIRAVGLELVEGMEREPAGGPDAAAAWSVLLPALAGDEPPLFDFVGDIHRVREFCKSSAIAFREISNHFIVVVPANKEAAETLIRSFTNQIFGIRARTNGRVTDAALEGEIARRGLDAYQPAYPSYFFCGISDFENGSVVILSGQLWASEIARRLRPALSKLEIQVQIAA